MKDEGRERWQCGNNCKKTGPRAFLVRSPIPRDQWLWSGDTNYILAYILVASISLFHTSQELTTAPSHSHRPRLLDTVVLIIGSVLFVAVFNRIVFGTGCDPCWFCKQNPNFVVSKGRHLCFVTSFACLLVCCSSFISLIISLLVMSAPLSQKTFCDSVKKSNKHPSCQLGTF